MQSGRLIQAGVAALALLAVLPASGQAAGASSSGLRMRVAVDAPPPGQILRVLDDPHTGNRWLLFTDPTHPGGPGRLVRIPGSPGASILASTPATTSSAAENLDQTLRPIIRAGDQILVEEHTPVVEARLEAVALGPATKGAFLAARLQIGGHVVRVLAVAPGRAELAAEGEEQP